MPPNKAEKKSCACAGTVPSTIIAATALKAIRVPDIRVMEPPCAVVSASIPEFSIATTP
jgi:hypothetical protein